MLRLIALLRRVLSATGLLERDHGPAPFCDPDSQADDSLLGPLLGGLIGPGVESERDGTEVLSPRAPLDSSTGFVAMVPYDTSDANAPLAIRQLN